MVKIYVRWVKDLTKDFTIDDVPKRWREQVRQALEEQ